MVESCIGHDKFQLEVLGLFEGFLFVRRSLNRNGKWWSLTSKLVVTRLDCCSSYLRSNANIRVSGNQSGNLPKSPNHIRWLPSPIRDSCKVIGTSSNPQIAEFVRKWSMDEVAMYGFLGGSGMKVTSVRWGRLCFEIKQLGPVWETIRRPQKSFLFVGRGQIFGWVKWGLQWNSKSRTMPRYPHCRPGPGIWKLADDAGARHLPFRLGPKVTLAPRLTVWWTGWRWEL